MRSTHWMAAFLAVAVALTLGVAAVTRAEEEPLKQDPADEAKPKEEPSPAAARIEALVKELGSEDYDTREAAYQELMRIGAAAKPALEKAARSPDVQTRVSAKRLLEKLRPRAGGRRELAPDRGREEWLEDSHRRLEEEAIPVPDGDPEAWRKAMEKRLEALRRNLDGLQRELERDVREGVRRAPPGVQRRVMVRSDEETIDCRVDASGKVKVEITREVDGKPKTETHEAESTDAFKKAHPEVWEKVKGFLEGGNRLRIEVGPPSWPFGGGRPDGVRPPFPVPAPNEGPHLGILVGEISPALRSHLGLAPEEGLLVDQVLPDTRAERLGLRRYDLLRSVHGTSVGSPADVREALGKLAKDEPVRVSIIRHGKALELVEKR